MYIYRPVKSKWKQGSYIIRCYLVVIGFLEDYGTMISLLYMDVLCVNILLWMESKLIDNCLYSFIIHSEIIMFTYYLTSSIGMFHKQNFYALEIIPYLDLLSQWFIIQSFFWVCDILRPSVGPFIAIFLSTGVIYFSYQKTCFFLTRSIHGKHFIGIIPRQFQLIANLWLVIIAWVKWLLLKKCSLVACIKPF